VRKISERRRTPSCWSERVSDLIKPWSLLNLVCTPTCSPSFSYCDRRTWSSAGFSGLSRCQYRSLEPGGEIRNGSWIISWNLTDLSASAASKYTRFVSIAVSSRRAYKKIAKWVWSFVSKILSAILTWKRGAHIFDCVLKYDYSMCVYGGSCDVVVFEVR